MTKEILEKEAEEWLRKFLLCNECKRKCHCIELNAYCEEQVLKAYIDSAEPREKRIAELERKLEQTEKDLTDYQFNYPKIKDLEKENERLRTRCEQARDEGTGYMQQLEKENAELKKKLAYWKSEYEKLFNEL